MKKNRNDLLNPTQDTFKAPVISFYPMTKCFHYSLRQSKMQTGFGDAGLLLRRRICVWTSFCIPSFFLHYLTKADGTRALLQHLSVQWCWSTQNVNPWPQPGPLTPHRSILLFEPLPWHTHTPIPHLNLENSSLRKQGWKVFCTGAALLHPPSSTLSFLHLTTLKRLPNHPPTPASTLPGLSHVRAAPCHCKLFLCISITEDLGNNLGMPVHLIRHGNTCVQCMWQRDTTEFCLHLCRCREEQGASIKTTLSIHANVCESRRMFSIRTVCLISSPIFF